MMMRSDRKDVQKRRIDKGRLKLTLMALPFVILIIVLSYVPLVGWGLAFTNYKPGMSLERLQFVGLKYFRLIGYYSDEVLNSLGATLFFSFERLFTKIIPLFFAICLSEIRSSKGRRVIQTAVTFPNFVSWVIVLAMANSLLSSNGLLNTIGMKLGWVDMPKNMLAEQKYPRLFISLLGKWKSMGWDSIVYVAAISSIDTQLYEAARIDGAGRFHCAMHVTVPGLMPTFIVLLLLEVGSIGSCGFDQYYLFSNPYNSAKLNVIDLFTYEKGIGTQDYSFATAVSMLKSIISVTLMYSVNMFAKRVRGESIL